MKRKVKGMIYFFVFLGVAMIGFVTLLTSIDTFEGNETQLFIGAMIMFFGVFLGGCSAGELGAYKEIKNNRRETKWETNQAIK